MIVPTYNQGALLARCLHSLTHQTLGRDRYEVIVVDDGSEDDTPERLADVSRDVRIRVIRLPRNRGRSAARNAGLAAAHTPLVVFVDSDVIVRAGFLAHHLGCYRRAGGGVLVRGPVVSVPHADAAATGRVPRVAASPAYLDTANALIEREAVERAGLFDEGFPGYGWEDFELGVRLQALGIRRVFCAQAVAFHVQPPLDLHAVPDLVRKENERARSAEYFLRKHPRPVTRFLVQATWLHRAVLWMLTAGGRLRPENMGTVVTRLRRAGFPGLGLLAARTALTHYYVQTLDRQLRRTPPLA